MDFLSLVLKGVEKSNKSKEAVAAVNEVFNQVNVDLKRYPLGELKLERSRSTLANIAAVTGRLANIESDYFIQDRVTLSLKTENNTFMEDVAGWKQHISGFPCTLKFDGQELSCGNPIHLINGLSDLLASVGFGNAVNAMASQAAKVAMEKPSTQSAKVSEPRQTNKPAAIKRVAPKPVAAKTVENAAAKRSLPTKVGGAKTAPARPSAGKPSPKSRESGEDNQPR